MTLDNEQIVRQAYTIAENKDLKGWVAAFTDDGTFTDESARSCAGAIRARSPRRAAACSPECVRIRRWIWTVPRWPGWWPTSRRR